MKKLSDLFFPKDISYTKSHEWAMAENDVVVVGISDYAQDQLGDIVYVELPELGIRLGEGAAFGTLESVKAVSEIYMPVSGEIATINEAIHNAPIQLNSAPYGEGWIIKIRPENWADLNKLMDRRSYLSALTRSN